MVYGSFEVLKIAPLGHALSPSWSASRWACPRAITAGGSIRVITFIANLVLAFPVILLFYLLVTPEIVAAGCAPTYLSMVPVHLPAGVSRGAVHSRLPDTAAVAQHHRLDRAGAGRDWPISRSSRTASDARLPTLFPPLARGAGPVRCARQPADRPRLVVFVNSPTVFRIVRGIVPTSRRDDYVAAARPAARAMVTSCCGEILPKRARAADRRFLPEDRLHDDPVWNASVSSASASAPKAPTGGSTINEGRRLLTIYPHPALPPALALMSLVLGLNPAGRRVARRKPEGLTMPNFRTRIRTCKTVFERSPLQPGP